MVRASMVPMLIVCGILSAQAPQPGPAAPAKQLSLREALQTALQYNLQVEISQQTREVARAGIMIQQGPFDWNFSASADLLRQERGGTSINNNGTLRQTATDTQRTLGVGLGKQFEWNGTLSLNYTPYAYNSTTGTFLDTPAPGTNTTFATSAPYTGTFTAKYSQNLLQGFGRRVTTAPLVVARKDADKADLQFQLDIVALLSKVETDYWTVVSAQRTLDNKRIALQLAQRLLNENQIKLKVGTMAPLDVTNAEAQVAKAELGIITAEADLANAKDTLVRDLYPNAQRPGALELTDAPNLGHIRLGEDDAVKMALDRRLELKRARLDQDITGLRLEVSRDTVRPKLNGFVQYIGLSNNRDAVGPVNSDLSGAKYPGYEVGLQFAVPIENRAARGGLAAARANLRGSELAVRNQELSITNDARQAVRTLDAKENAIKAAEKARILQEKSLEAEQKKFDNGMSTNLNVLQAMNNLDAARADEVQAQIDYTKAVTNLEVTVGNLLDARNFSVK